MMAEIDKKAETPQQRAIRLIAEIESASPQHYTKGEVKTILNSIAQIQDRASGALNAAAPDEGCRGPVETKTLLRGDVFIAKLVGGKVRPWIALRITGKVVVAVAVSSGDHFPGAIPAKCRFWPGNWIGSTVSLFDLAVAVQEVTRPYTNARHLQEIEANVAKAFGFCLPVQKPAQSMAEIAAKLRVAS